MNEYCTDTVHGSIVQHIKHCCYVLNIIIVVVVVVVVVVAHPLSFFFNYQLMNVFILVWRYSTAVGLSIGDDGSALECSNYEDR